jgi:PilZ domain
MSDLLNITASPGLAVPSSDGDIPENEMQGKEKREHPRYGCEGYAEVFLPQGGLLFHGRILNLSRTGCYIETPLLDLERGTQVEVYFVTNQLQFRVLGNIAALRRKRGAGIVFVNLSLRKALQIATLVGELADKETGA